MRRQFISAVVGLFLLCGDATNGEVPKFEVGKSYTFDYSSEVRANSKGAWSHLTADEIADGLTIETKAQVVIRGLSETEFLLIFKDGQLKTRSFSKEAQEGPPASVKLDYSVMKFSYVDGMVTFTTQNPDEPTWSVNIKRAVLSLLQNKAFSPSMDKGTGIEESVLGQCVTKYDLTTSDSGNEYKKEIALNECGLSEGSDIISQGVPYQMDLVTNKPLFGFLRPSRTIVECRQTVSKDLVLTSAVCGDKDSEHSILNHKQQSSLTFVDSTTDVPMPDDSVISKLTLSSQSLLYDFVSSQKSSTAEGEKMALEKMKVLLGYDDFDMSTKDELSFFADFKSLIPQVADLSELKELIAKSPRKKIFYDAAAEVVSDSAVLLLVQADKAGTELDLTTKLTFYGSLPFVRKPGLKALAALGGLVKEIQIPALPETPRTGEALKVYAKDVSMIQHLLLGVSGAAYRYCMQTDASCENKEEYTTLIDSLASHVKESGHEGAEIDVTLAALYALGNTVSLTPGAARKLVSLISNEALMIPIRLAALDAFRRDPCEPSVIDEAKTALNNKGNSDEVRIQAYLATVKCLKPDTIEAIKGVLDETENNIVKGFIASHIKNIQASKSPSTSNLQLLMSSIEIPSSIVPIQDTPRVSTFVEHSTFRHKENIGFSGSMTVFFTPGQTHPQFVSFNKTIDLFGRSYNLIELGFSQRMLPSTRIFHPETSPPDWSSLHRAIHAKDSYVRVFGTTVAMGMDGIHKAMQLAFFKISNGTIFMDLIQPATLLDEKLSTATVTGLPMTLGLDATALKALKVEMTAEPVRKLVNSLFALAPEEGQDFDLKLDMKVHASASGLASASVGGESPIRIGYAVEGRMDKKYTWGVEASSSRLSPDESSVSFKLNFPEESIVSKKVTGKIYSFQEVNGVSGGDSSGGSSTAVAVPPKMFESINAKCDSCDLLGLKSCANATMPESRRMFPFTMTATIGKLEESVTGFVLSSSIKRETDADGNQRSLHTVSLSTPGSSNPREIKATLVRTANKGEYYVGDSWTTYDWEVDTALNQDKFQGILKLNSSNQPSLYLGVGKNSGPVESIVDIKFRIGQERDWTLDGKFGGPLTYFAEELSVVGATSSSHNFQDYTNRQTIKAKLTSRYLKNPSLKEELTYLRSVQKGDNKTKKYIYENRLRVDLVSGEETLTVIAAKNDSYIYQDHSDPESPEWSNPDYAYVWDRLEEYHKIYLSWVASRSRPKSLEIAHGVAYLKEEMKNMINASIIVDSGSRYLAPVKAEMETEVRWRLGVNGTVQVNLMEKENGPQKLGNMRFNMQNLKTLDYSGEIKGISDFKGSADVSEKKSHIHMDVNILPKQTSISFDFDLRDDGNLVNEETGVVITFARDESVITKNTSTVVNRAERSFKHQGTVTDNKGTVLQSLHMEAQFQPSFESSGVSTFSWEFHNVKGSHCQGTINKTLTMSPPIYKSLVEAEVNAGRGPEKKEPIKITKEVTYDASVGPEYSAQGHVSVVEKVTSRGLKMDVAKDLSWSVKKDEPVAMFNIESNATVNGKKISSSLGGEWKGDKSDDKKGEITLIGKLQDPRQSGEGDLKISYEGDIKTLQTVRGEGEVNSTPLSTGEKTSLVVMNFTRTLKVPKFPLMSAAEVGSIKLPQTDTEYSWDEEVVVAERDFVLHKGVKVTRHGVQKFEEDFLIHVSVHVNDDEVQKSLSVRTDHNFNPSNPTCPFRQMNFTLSR